MKFVSEGEQVFPHSTPGRKPDSIFFEYHVNGVDSTGLKSENSIIKECKTGALCALNANEGDADHLPYMTNDADGWAARNLDRSTSLINVANDSEKDVRDFKVIHSHSCGEMELFKEPVFYMDKSVTECELPELVVCHKENTYHVKDICVDEGLRSRDRILFDSYVDKKVARAFLPPEEGRNSELMAETKNSVMPVPYVLKSSAETDSSQESDCDDAVNQFDSKKDEATDRIGNDGPKKLFSLGELLSLHKVGTETSHSKSSNDNKIEAQIDSFQGASGKAASGNPVLIGTVLGTTEEILTGEELVSPSEKLQNDCGEAISGNPALFSAAEKAHDISEGASSASTGLVSASEESTKISSDDKLSYNSNVETGSIMFDFDASSPRASGKEDQLQIGEHQHIENMPGTTSTLEDAPRQSVSGQIDTGLGESSLSAAGSLPSLISYSGLVAYSGNVSLRSDSSTTSTRSFAFPVLQSEWNSSPVRMAKADRRHYRKNKWRPGLFCCRF